nr:guanylate kinase [Tessaracoccus sp. OS52]
MRELRPEVFFSVSMTTRPPRPSEVPGVSYHFVTDELFCELIDSGQLLEHAVVHGLHRYGTPRRPVVEALAAGRTVVLEIDLQGARQVKRNLPEAKLVFLQPPSWDELVNRLRGRGTEDEEAQQRRLETAKLELEAITEADEIVENDDVEKTVAHLIGLMGL